MINGIDNIDDYDVKHPIYLKDLYEILKPFSRIRLLNTDHSVELDKAPGTSEVVEIQAKVLENELEYFITIVEEKQNEDN